MISKLKTIIVLTGSIMAGSVAFCSADSVSWPVCGKAKRITCIVDGDTFWQGGIKYRLLGVDTPEADEKAQCVVERELANKATKRLQQLLQSGGLTLESQGTDRYDRTLVIVTANGANVADVLISERFGRPYEGSKRDPQQWCQGTQ